MEISKLVNQSLWHEKCSICKENIGMKKELIERKHNDVNCKICGHYLIDPLLEVEFFKNKEINHTLPSWIREQNEYNINPLLDLSEKDNLLTISDKSLDAKYIKFLKYIQHKIDIENLGSFDIVSDFKNLFVICWIKNTHEFGSFIEEAKDQKHIMMSEENSSEIISILFQGRKYIEPKNNSTSNKIFMAFHFTKNMKKEFEETIITAVKEASNNKFEAVRVSSSTTEHDTKIDDELISMIKSSKAVIADFTGNRTAVYYEAGFAMGLGIPVIWTCKDSNIPEGEEGYGKITDDQGQTRYKRYIDLLSFDTRQYPHILWKDEEDLQTQVVNSLKAKIL